MTILVLLFFLLLAVIALIFKWQKTVVTLFLIIFSYIFLIGDGLLPKIVLTSLQAPYVALPHPVWKKSNGIILLGAGLIQLPDHQGVSPTIIADSRINKAASLYQACNSTHNHCTIIISGGDILHLGITESATYQNQLIHLGVKKTDILLEAQSVNTYQNAVMTKKLLSSYSFDQLFLVTSGVHLKRASLLFLKNDVMTKPVMADYMQAQCSWLPKAFNFVILDSAIHEYLGIAEFYVYEWMGWNVKA